MISTLPSSQDPATESIGLQHPDLDLYTTEVLVAALLDDQLRAAQVVRAASESIASAVDRAVPLIRSGGRLIYVGAGTSGRLGFLDAVELWPTFSWPAQRAVPLIAGGANALIEALEGAEDSFEAGRRDVEQLMASEKDVVIVVSASGSTRYCLGGLQAAKEAGALSIGVANNPGAPVAELCDAPLILDTGSEVISGSTRLKAGTAQKILLNTFSSALMVRLHKVYRNLMVDLRPTNAKLYTRAARLTTLATGCEESLAVEVLKACGYSVKQAIVVIALGISPEEAARRLTLTAGSVRAAIAQTPLDTES